MNVLNTCSTAAALLTRHGVVVVVIAVIIAVVVTVIIAVVIIVIIANPVASVVVCIPPGFTSAIKTAVDAWPLVSVRASHRIVLVAITPR